MERSELITSCQAKQMSDETVLTKYREDLEQINTEVEYATRQGQYNIKVSNTVPLADEVQVYLVEQLGYRLIPGYDEPKRGETQPIPYIIIDWNTTNCK